MKNWNSKPKQRIDYIDRMKGMAIFLVVMGHVYGFALGQADDVANRVIGSFHMPLFMFLSGLVACSGAASPFWSLPKLGRKLRGLILPLLFFGFAFTMTWAKDWSSGMVGLLESPSKNGYWYLMTLAVFYVSLSLFRLNVWRKWYVDVGLAIVIWGGYLALWRYTAQRVDYFCLLNCGNFYPFFILGVFTAKYGLLEKVRQANWLFSLCVAGYIGLFLSEMPLHALDSLNKHIFLPFCMVAVVVTLFMGRHGKTSPVERVLDYVGKRTLDVYVIHYFFVSQIHLTGLGKNLETSGDALLVFVLAVFLSAIVTALAIGVGNVLHHGKWIERIVYGKG